MGKFLGSFFGERKERELGLPPLTPLFYPVNRDFSNYGGTIVDTLKSKKELVKNFVPLMSGVIGLKWKLMKFARKVRMQVNSRELRWNMDKELVEWMVSLPFKVRPKPSSFVAAAFGFLGGEEGKRTWGERHPGELQMLKIAAVAMLGFASHKIFGGVPPFNSPLKEAPRFVRLLVNTAVIFSPFLSDLFSRPPVYSCFAEEDKLCERDVRFLEYGFMMALKEGNKGVEDFIYFVQGFLEGKNDEELRGLGREKAALVDMLGALSLISLCNYPLDVLAKLVVHFSGGGSDIRNIKNWIEESIMAVAKDGREKKVEVREEEEERSFIDSKVGDIAKAAERGERSEVDPDVAKDREAIKGMVEKYTSDLWFTLHKLLEGGSNFSVKKRFEEAQSIIGKVTLLRSFPLVIALFMSNPELAEELELREWWMEKVGNELLALAAVAQVEGSYGRLKRSYSGATEISWMMMGLLSALKPNLDERERLSKRLKLGWKRDIWGRQRIPWDLDRAYGKEGKTLKPWLKIVEKFLPNLLYEYLEEMVESNFGVGGAQKEDLSRKQVLSVFVSIGTSIKKRKEVISSIVKKMRDGKKLSKENKEELKGINRLIGKLRESSSSAEERKGMREKVVKELVELVRGSAEIGVKAESPTDTLQGTTEFVDEQPIFKRVEYIAALSSLLEDALSPLLEQIGPSGNLEDFEKWVEKRLEDEREGYLS